MIDLEPIDAMVNSTRYAPRWGWHDDHRSHDRTPAYLPAIQQVRSEFAGLLEVLKGADVLKGRCLQLGRGECQASHDVWSALFRGGAVTIDWACNLHISSAYPGGDTHDERCRGFAEHLGSYSFLFIDAGHKLDDVRRDHADYAPLVIPGGIIAFHDSAKRPGYENEIDVWRYLDALDEQVNFIGAEVGVAWIVNR